ncbi:hypothetical protein B0T18DRAFT_432687 [Schizothecium vesticola]|uniref:DUF6604 domain-containing protein n=1 Tax=Schizothecium vesticola TaxID=314040 RepID=A0AA40EDS9_9PEZI|nr:hypothetical protein B0T18DRAFT_432687 [Schizothecium vesticola]
MCKAYHNRQETFTTWLLATAGRLHFAVPCHGQSTMGSLEALARAVTTRLPPGEIPADIVDSLRDVVWLRKEANAVFCQAADQQDDGEAKRRSDEHVHAIHVFERILAVFNALTLPCAQWEAAARWEASRAGVTATLHDFLRRHAEVVAAMTRTINNDVTLRRDSGISMTMTIGEDVPAEYLDYQVQGQYHMPLEN